MMQNQERCYGGLCVMMLVVILLGCATPQLEYRRSHVETTSKAEPIEGVITTTPRAETFRRPDFDLNEIAIYDYSGGGCAGLFNTMDAAASSKSAVDKAYKENKSTATATVRVRNPLNYRGVGCGGYWRWGSRKTEDGKEQTWREGGLAFRAYEPWFQDWFDGKTPFYGGFDMRLLFDAVDLDGDGEVGSENIVFSWPINVVMFFSPEWLYGVSLKGSAGADWIAHVFASDAENNWTMFDYGAYAGYMAQFGDLTIEAWFGWNRNNRAWAGDSTVGIGEYVLLQGNEISGTLGVSYAIYDF